MRTRALSGLLALCLLLSGCSSMMERSYEAVIAHEDKPVTAEDSSILRVENYQELVSAVLYLISQRQEEGTIQLYDYADDVESALTDACLEVATEDPLGAYAVDYIKHECTRVVSYYQATLSIHYRRTEEQIRSIVNVTGSSAIRSELQEALTSFSGEVVLRVAYFAEDEASIAQLVRQAYYDTPVAALGMPTPGITLYPDHGSQRVVEITLTYPEPADELWRKSEQLAAQAGTISGSLRGLDARAAVLRVISELRSYAAYSPEGGNTAYAALVDGSSDAEGLALAYALLCQQVGVTCEVVEGTYLGKSWFWNTVQVDSGERLYLDAALGDGLLHTAEELTAAGYQWAGALGPE